MEQMHKSLLRLEAVMAEGSVLRKTRDGKDSPAPDPSAGEPSALDRDMLSRFRNLVPAPGPSPEECRAFLGILRGLDVLGVDAVRISSLPLCLAAMPEGAGEEEGARDRMLAGMLAGLEVHPSSTHRVSLSCACLLGFLGAVPARGVCGRIRAVATIDGDDGHPPLGAILFSPQGEIGEDGAGQEAVLQLETHVDHLTGEEVGLALEALAGTPGVLDVLWLTGMGKKHRPMGLLRLLCHPKDGAEVGRALVRHTHTLGYREELVWRHVLPRRSGQGRLSDGTEVPAKEYGIDNVWYSRPESDAVRRVAGERQVGAPALRIARAPRRDEGRDEGGVRG